MKDNIHLIVTSISAPNDVLKSLAMGSFANNISFIVVGDSKSPPSFVLENCRFYSLAEQKNLSLKLAEVLPERHYARKNIGYLEAIRNGATILLETDDDNYPTPDFWQPRKKIIDVPLIENESWVNVYHYFSDGFIWPRGYPMEHLKKVPPEFDNLERKKVFCPIQQGLADENPDVDAVYRLTYPLPFSFNKNHSVALGKGSWCPFNSQNTTWFKEVFPLLYLPTYCSFRMTDIWRSFVAQRILWENNLHLLFHGSTVWQERNEHNLLDDFKDEIPGYLNNDKIKKELEDMDLKKGFAYLGQNLRKCYQTLIALELVDKKELVLIDAWNRDFEKM